MVKKAIAMKPLLEINSSTTISTSKEVNTSSSNQERIRYEATVNRNHRYRSPTISSEEGSSRYEALLRCECNQRHRSVEKNFLNSPTLKEERKWREATLSFINRHRLSYTTLSRTLMKRPTSMKPFLRRVYLHRLATQFKSIFP